VRLIAATLFGLVAGGLLFHPAFLIQWYDGLLPFSPGRGQPAAVEPPGGWPKVDPAKDAVVLAWPARKLGFTAPALALRVAPTEWYGWWSSTPRGPVKLPPDGLAQIALDVSIPNGETLLPEHMTPLCQLAVDPFAGCAGARGRVILSRDGGEREILLGESAPAEQVRVTPDGRKVAVLQAFWTRRDEDSGRERFVGWECPNGPQDLPLGASSDGRPAVLYQCFQPGKWWERQRPGWFGYEKRRLYTRCVGSSGCEMAFLFEGRAANLEFTEVMPARDVERARYRLLLSAWDLLDRQRQDALQAPAPARNLADARAQLAMCEQVAAEAAALPPDRRMRLTQDQRHRMGYLSIACVQAALIAAAAAKADASAAEPLLARALKGMSTLDAFRADAAALFDAWFAAMEAKGRGESVDALEAHVLYLRAVRLAPNDPGREARDRRVQAARTLLAKYGRALSEPALADAYQTLRNEYRDDAQRVDLARLAQEYATAVAGKHGGNSLQVLKPLSEAVVACAFARDADGTRETSTELERAWLAQAGAYGAPMEPARTVLASSGVYLVFGLRTVAFNDLTHAEVAPRVAAIVTRMRQLLGNDDPWVRGAEFHQREVVTRQAVNGVPIGGGLLGR
jgi:hypothetical protein